MKTSSLRSWIPWLDAAAIAAWGILLLRYWLTGKLNLLIHPAYTWLSVLGGLGLLAVGGFKLVDLWQQRRRRSPQNLGVSEQHITLLPQGWSSLLLLVAAIVGILITPRPFASQTALNVGVRDLLTATRSQPQSFRGAKNPEERSLIDWIKTLNVYPEPDAYVGQKVKIAGFVIHPPDFPEGYMVLARFVITCCAADAYPVGLPVKLPPKSQDYPADTWLEVTGVAIADILLDERKLAVRATSASEIPEPDNPYEY